MDDVSSAARDLPWDEAMRPTLDEPRDATYPPEQESVAQHLVEVHDHLRGELAQVRDLVAQVRRGLLSVGEARSGIHAMTLRQNNWTLGAYCAAYCSFVNGHHTMEDTAVFPHLRRSEPGAGPVLDRLTEEHHVIHEVLERLDRALVDLVGEEAPGDALDRLEVAVDLLADTLVSHLAYEERELRGPLARQGFY
jgi:Hemerythrin HHE cation binding domain